MPTIGRFSVYNAPEVYITLVYFNYSISVKALIDTGFTGFIIIPSKIAKELELVIDGSNEYTIADGTESSVRYSVGEVEFAGTRYTGEIGWIEESTDNDVLIGCELLDEANVVIDYEKKEIRVP